jgi:hypothetical protein
MSEQDIQTAADETTYCAVHPDRETGLRCNKCDRYMCAECAVQTPVGFRCKQCVRQVEDRFFDATQVDYIILFIVGAVMSALGSFIASLIGFFFLLIFFLAIPVGGVISEAALRAIKRRKGRYSGQVAAAGVIAGVLGFSLVVLGGIAPMLLVFGGVIAFIVYGRFRMRG